MSANAASWAARAAADAAQSSSRLRTTRAGANGDAAVRHVAPDHGVCTQYTPPAHPGSPQHRHLGGDPAVRSDPHGALDDALVLDRRRDVGVAVVEVGDVHPVGHQGRRADLDVQICVDDVVPAEHHLVPDAERPLVAADRVAVPDVHPASNLQPGQPGRCGQLHPFAQEQHAAQHHMRVGHPEPQQPPVAHQVPRGPRAVSPHPAQRVQGEETSLFRLTSARPQPDTQRRRPPARHGGQP